MTEAKDSLIRLPKVEDRVGYKRSKIYQMIKAHEFPSPIKRGRDSLWSEQAVQAWIEQQKTSQAA